MQRELEKETGFFINQVVYHRATGEMGVVVGFISYTDHSGTLIQVKVSFGPNTVFPCYQGEIATEKPVEVM